jgi:low affinity Fe/Cu permease
MSNSIDPKPPTPTPPIQVPSPSFSRFASRTAAVMGSSGVFVLAVGGVVVWGLTGPHFHYSDTWQLVINTSTTIITFLMVFLIQNTQNRDARALQLKLDEIIRSHKPARNEMINIEKLSDAELEELAKHYQQIRLKCEQQPVAQGRDDSKESASVV